MSPRSEEYLTKKATTVDKLISQNEINAKPKEPTKFQIVWFNVVLQILIHLGAFYGIYCCFFAKYQTLVLGKKISGLIKNYLNLKY